MGAAELASWGSPCLLHHVAILGAHVRGVHLNVIVTGDGGELHLDLPVALLQLPYLALYLDLLHRRPEDLAQHRQCQRLLAGPRHTCTRRLFLMYI
jgi:hypothetical protein